MSEYEALAIRIKMGRSHKNETQIEFAENCDISTKTLSKIENSTADPRLSTLQKIAAYTGETVSGLLRINPEE